MSGGKRYTLDDPANPDGIEVSVENFDGDLVIDTAAKGEDGTRLWLKRSARGEPGWVVFVHRYDGSDVVMATVPDHDLLPARVEVGSSRDEILVPVQIVPVEAEYLSDAEGGE